MNRINDAEELMLCWNLLLNLSKSLIPKHLFLSVFHIGSFQKKSLQSWEINNQEAFGAYMNSVLKQIRAAKRETHFPMTTEPRETKYSDFCYVVWQLYTIQTGTPF